MCAELGSAQPKFVQFFYHIVRQILEREKIGKEMACPPKHRPPETPMAILFANLSQQLENYKNYGPPQIGKALMSEEDFRFAKKFMEWGDESLDQHIQEFNKDDDNAEEIKFLEKNVLNDAGEGNSHVDISTVTCVSCGEEVSCEAANVLCVLSTNVLSTKDDESETFLKQLQKAQNEGLSIEYRCPSLREEASRGSNDLGLSKD